MCSGVVRACGAERARLRADAPCRHHPNPHRRPKRPPLEPHPARLRLLVLRTPRRLHRRVRRSFRPLRFPPSLRRRHQKALSLHRQRQRRQHPRRHRPTRLARPMWRREHRSCRKWRARWSFPARTSTLAQWQNLPRSSKRRPVLRWSSTQVPGKPISTTCAATISTTAPTWRPSGTTCRSICPPTRMAKATPTSIF